MSVIISVEFIPQGPYGYGYTTIFEGDDGDDVLDAAVLGVDVHRLITIELQGLGGDDVLTARANGSVLEGSVLDGGDGDDMLRGGAGRDSLIGGLGVDLLDGGGGYDKGYWRDVAESVVFTFGPEMRAESASGDSIDTLVSIETIYGSSHGDSYIVEGPLPEDLEKGQLFIWPGAGDDVISVAGADVRIIYAAVDTALRIDLMEGVVEARDGVSTEGVGRDSLIGVTQVAGSTEGDAIRGSDAEDLLLGLTGDDEILGGAGDDVLDGGEGDDLLDGGVGDDELRGGGGFDVFVSSAGDDLYNGVDPDEDDDAVVLSFAADPGAVDVNVVDGVARDGFGGVDALVGRFALIEGSAFDDVLTGDAGDNFFAGGAGDDLIDGGDGQDSVSYANAFSGVFVDLAAERADDGEGSVDALQSIEGIAGSRFADVILGSDADEQIDGADGDDVIVAAGGRNIINGGAGDDIVVKGAGYETIDAGDGFDVLDLSALEGTAQFSLFDDISGRVGDAGYLEAVNFEAIIGSDHGDHFSISSYWARHGQPIDLFLGAGDDQVSDSFDGDRYDTGVTVNYAFAEAGVRIDLGAKIGESIEAGDAANIGRDYLLGVRRVAGSEHDDIIVGVDRGVVPHSFTGGAGDDLIVAYGENNLFSFFGAASGVSANMNNGRAASDDGDLDRFSGIQHLDGSDFGDALTGDDAANELFGFDGDDRLEGRDGDDLLVGGLGADALYGGAGDDLLVGGLDADALHGAAGDDLLVGGLGADALYGAGGDDTIYAGVGDTRASGGGGEDTLWADTERVEIHYDLVDGTADFGGAQPTLIDGFEIFIGGRFEDRITPGDGQTFAFYGDSADDVLDLSRLTTSGDVNLELGRFRDDAGGFGLLDGVRDVVGSASDDQVVGDRFHNEIYGGGGDDVIDGGGGNDLLYGGGGRDLLNGGAGSDAAAHVLAPGAVTINLAAGYVIGADGARNQLVSIERGYGSRFDDIIIGDDGRNVLTGHHGDDRIVGRGGDDIMGGGRGDDIYAVEQAGDRVYESADAGYDRVNTWVDFRNADNVEFLCGKFADQGLTLIGNGLGERIYGSEYDDKIDGWRGDDWAAGLGGDDYMNGGAGNDVLYGNSGDDVLRGGGGEDWLAGQSGADRFVHRAGDGADTVRDFTVGQDVLDLSGHDLANFYAFRVAARDVDDGVLIYLGDGGSIMLQGVSELDLNVSDVIL